MLFRRTLEGELVKKSVTRIRLMNAVFGKTQRAGLKTYTFMKIPIVMKSVIGATISNSYGYLAWWNVVIFIAAKRWLLRIVAVSILATTSSIAWPRITAPIISKNIAKIKRLVEATNPFHTTCRCILWGGDIRWDIMTTSRWTMLFR